MSRHAVNHLGRYLTRSQTIAVETTHERNIQPNSKNSGKSCCSGNLNDFSTPPTAGVGGVVKNATEAAPLTLQDPVLKLLLYLPPDLPPVPLNKLISIESGTNLISRNEQQGRSFLCKLTGPSRLPTPWQANHDP